MNSTPNSETSTHIDVEIVESQQMNESIEETIYEIVAIELESGNVRKGLWTRLYAECNGDETQTKVLYIKQRAESLIAAEHARMEHAALERAAETLRTDPPRIFLTDDQQMEKYGITFDGERYTYGEYKYDRLSDAINYAKLQEKRSI